MFNSPLPVVKFDTGLLKKTCQTNVAKVFVVKEFLSVVLKDLNGISPCCYVMQLEVAMEQNLGFAFSSVKVTVKTDC